MSLPVGTLVWAKAEDLFWPALVIDEQEAPSSITEAPHTSEQILLRFFGQPVSYGWVDTYLPFRDNYKNCSTETRANFVSALQEAEQYEMAQNNAHLLNQDPVQDEDLKESSESSGDSSYEEASFLPKRNNRSQRRAATKRKKHSASSSLETEHDGDQPPKKESKYSRRSTRTPGKNAASNKPKTSKIRKNANFKQKFNVAKDVYTLVSNIRIHINNNQPKEALLQLKTFDPVQPSANAHPFSKLGAYELKLSRLGKLIHCLSRHPDDSISSYCKMLLNHFRNAVRSEFDFPEELKAVGAPRTVSSSTIHIMPVVSNDHWVPPEPTVTVAGKVEDSSNVLQEEGSADTSPT